MALPTSTIFADDERVVVSLDGDFPGLPVGFRYTTFLLDSDGFTTRTLGWTDDPTAFLQRPTTNTVSGLSSCERNADMKSSMMAALHVNPKFVTIWFESLYLLCTEPDAATENRHCPGDVCGF